MRFSGALIDHVSAVDWGFDIAAVPTATIRIRGAPPASAAFDAQVTIEAGFNNVNTRQFTGEIQGVDRDGPDTIITCMGKAHALDVPYHKVVYTFTNVTDQQAITDFLNNAKVQQFQVNMPTPLWTIGTVVQQTITLQTWGEAIMKVAEVNGAAWYEYPSGVIIVQRVDPIPSFTAAKQYFTMVIAGLIATYPTGITQTLTVDGTSYATLPHIRTIRLEQQIREVKNQVFVKGATIGVVQADGTTTPFDVTATAFAPSPWVVNPDGTQAYNDFIYPNELIDTVAQAGITAQRLIDLKNRLDYKGTLTVDFDPTILLGMTVQIEDPSYAGASGNWFVTGYSTSMSETDAVTTITVIGGGTSGGQSNLLPIPFFVWTIEREVMNDREWAFVTFNGLLSTDLDGTIASYAWSDNQALVSGTTAVITVRVDPATVTVPWNVTLTVTDNKGASAAQTLTISLAKTDKNVSVPGMFVAFRNYMSASPDGGLTWNDQATPGGRSAEAVGAMPRGGLAGCAVFGCSDGTLWQTKDFCRTVPVAVATGLGSAVKHIYADNNNITHIYALTQNGQVWRSLSNGDSGTWILYEDLRVKLSLPALRANRIALPKGSPTGGIWVFGGTGAGRPLVTFDAVANHDWAIAATGGELAADLGLGAAVPPGLQFAQGTYTGDGNTVARAITGLGFKPKAVILRGNTATNGHALILTDTMPTAKNVTNSTNCTGIVSLDTDGFSVRDNAPDTNGRGNVLGVTYYWFAVGGDYVATGSYTGDGVDNREIVTGIPLDMVWVARMTGNVVRWKHSGMGAISSDFSVSDGTDTDAIKSFASDGFVIGTNADVNTSSVAYHYVGFKTGAPNLVVGTYTGNGVDNRNLPSPAMAFSPNMALTKIGGGAFQEATWKITSLAGDAALEMGATVAAANLIQSLTPATGQFQVGTNANVNANTLTYWFFAFQTLSATVGGAAPADLFIYEAASTEQRELAIILDSATYQPSVYYTDDIFGDGSHWRRATGLPAKTHGRYIGGDLEIGKFFIAYNDTALYKGDVTNGIMQVTAQAGVLQANDATNHGVFLGWYIGGIASIYLLAAEGTVDGTIWKTWDRGATIQKLRPATGFPAALGSMDAKQISIADSANVTLDNLYAAQSPRDGSTSKSYRLRIAQLGAAWANVTNPGATTQGEIAWVYHLGAAYYRLIASAISVDAHNQPGAGQVQRSTDLIAWSNVGPAPVGFWGVTNMDIGADGTLWMVTGDFNNGATQPRLYKSTDDGLTFPEVTTITVAANDAFWDVACHPTNKDFVVVMGDNTNSGAGRLWKSTNATGAATFTKTSTNGNLGSAHVGNCVLLAGGRLVLNHGDTIAYTDDYTTVVDALTAPLYGYQIYRNSSGSVLFVMVGGTSTSDLYRSKDGGTTWRLVSNSFGTARTFASAKNAYSMFYDEVLDKLYVGFEGTAQMVLLIPNAGLGAVPVSDAVIFDLTLNLSTLWGGGATDRIAPQGLFR